MNIVGWIRKGDRAACDGVVVQGCETDTSLGRAYAYQGAQMGCRHACKIAQGFSHATLSNQRNMVHHGQRTMRGCQLLSSLNEVDGISSNHAQSTPLPPDSKVFKPITDDVESSSGLALKNSADPMEVPSKLNQRCYHETFKVTDLPFIMQRQGWEVGAALMNEWFSRKGFFRTLERVKEEVPFRGYGPNNINSSIVTMDWLLSFDRFKNKLDELLAYEHKEIVGMPLFATQASQLALIYKLHTQGLISNQPCAYNPAPRPAIFHEQHWQHQRILFDSIGSRSLLQRLRHDCIYDDADAALGNFSIHLASSGRVIPSARSNTKTWQVRIQTLHVYLKDSYDFDKFQYLGNWALHASPGLNTHWRKGLLGSLPLLKNCPKDYVAVFNSDFRAYRNATNWGGDFLIFSDVKTIPLKKEYVFTCHANDIENALINHKK